MPWTRSYSNWEWVRRRWCQSGGASFEAPPYSCSFILRMFSARSCSQIEAWLLLWWHTSRQAVMRRCILSISEHHGRLRRRMQWKDLATCPWPVQVSPGWWASFLCGSQPAVTPSTWVMQLEEESANKEECIDSEDPDGTKGVTEEFIVCLARTVKDAQQGRSTVITVAIQIISSTIAHWWWDLRQTLL